MHVLLLDLVCCPECRHFPLELTVLQSHETATAAPVAVCERHCGRDQVSRTRSAAPACTDCLNIDVETGFLYCPGCARFYFVVAGIPRLLSEHFSELIDLSVPERFAHAFDGRRRELDAFLSRLAHAPARSEQVQWNLDDVDFWEDRVYGDDETTVAAMAQISRGRPDAGNRTYPRERCIFRHLRPTLPRSVMLDLGCGLAQTIRVLCDPATVGYVYIGADLSISALRTNRATMAGEFVQCSANRLPFREHAVDALLTLGTIHHLADHDEVLSGMIATVRPGGMIGLEEVVARRGLTDRIRLLGRFHTAESAHNESVELDLLQRRLSEAGTIRVLEREYSPVRSVLSAWLSEPMRTRPWLTRLVLGLDALCIGSLGRWFPFFAGRSALMLAQLSSPPRTSAQPAARSPAV